jgi:hypothetical protein
VVSVIPSLASVWGGTTPAGTTDRTAMGLNDRLLVGHSVRPVGVGWVPEPGRRIVIRTAPRDVSRSSRVTPGSGTHPHADRHRHLCGGPTQRPNPILAAGFGTSSSDARSSRSGCPAVWRRAQRRAGLHLLAVSVASKPMNQPGLLARRAARRGGADLVGDRFAPSCDPAQACAGPFGRLTAVTSQARAPKKTPLSVSCAATVARSRSSACPVMVGSRSASRTLACCKRSTAS